MIDFMLNMMDSQVGNCEVGSGRSKMINFIVQMLIMLIMY